MTAWWAYKRLPASLQGSGLRVAVLEQRACSNLWRRMHHTTARFGYQCRQRKITHRLGVWQDILSRRACCYHGMEVWDKDSFGHISFDDQSMGYSHLGHIVENSSDSLRAVEQSAVSGYHSVGPRRITAGRLGENETFLTLKDGHVNASGASGADGANSRLRNKADIPLTSGIISITRWWRPFARKNHMMRWRGRIFRSETFWPFMLIRVFLVVWSCRQRKRSGCSEQ